MEIHKEVLNKNQVRNTIIFQSDVNWVDSNNVLENQYLGVVKGVLDYLCALVLFVFLLSWITPILILIIRLTSKGPAIFKQERIGYEGKIFTCYKFRTMYLNNSSDWQQCEVGDERITKVGHFLRETHIDELPQIWNVLKGEMSLVGPRPHMISDDFAFASLVDEYKYRRKLKPGITGLAQVKGFYGATNTNTLIYGRVKMDLFYLRNASFLLDLKILIHTFLLPFSK